MEMRVDPVAVDPFDARCALEAKARAAAARRREPYLDAGRCNPDWLSAVPREAFFLLGRCACEALTRRNHLAHRQWRDGPEAGHFLEGYLHARHHDPAALWLRQALDWAEAQLGMDRHLLAGELLEAALGARYPEPAAILPAVERLCRAHLARALAWPEAQAATTRLFATEGSTAAVCDLFASLLTRGLLTRGDRVAVITPAYSPYLELLHQPRMALELECLELPVAHGGTHQPSAADLDRLRDPRVRLLVVVNPGNPLPDALDEISIGHIEEVVSNGRSDLLILSDEVYAPLAPGRPTLSARLPHNTLGVFSFSKFFGATGWRLGLVCVAADHLVDRLAGHRSGDGDEPAPLPPGDFLTQLVADSRAGAFRHTAGLSTPQQAQMALFALSALLDAEDRHGRAVRDSLAARRQALWQGLGFPAPLVPGHTGFYELLSLPGLVARWMGDHAAFEFDSATVTARVLERLAGDHGVVALPGAGFQAPVGTIRLCLANLSPPLAQRLGEAIREACLADEGAA